MIFTFSCYYSSYSPEKLRHDTALWLITFVPFIPVHRILSVSLLLFYEAPVEVESTKAGGKAAIPFINVFSSERPMLYRYRGGAEKPQNAAELVSFRIEGCLKM